MTATDPRETWIGRLMGVCMERPLIVVLLVVLGLFYGLSAAPFESLSVPGLARDPVPVDALPDTGENQQIVFTEWPGRSPQDVEDQVTYPLTVALLGVPGVKTIRSSSMFGFSSIHVIFDESVDFYWSRSRIVEKLASLSANTLPEGVKPALGPDATAMGQVFWYTLEPRDRNGDTTTGFGLDELRSIQDFRIRYALAGVEGVSEVASIGGYVREYQIDVDPDAMRAHRVTLTDVFRAVRQSNVDVGARTIEVNGAEYVIRGIGFVQAVHDLEEAVVAVREGVPITVAQVAHAAIGPALRRGALDKGGAEAVGGVVVVRYGANPLKVIERVKDKIREIAPGLPSRTLDDGTVTRVTIVPFYDRTGLIHETLDTLSTALRLAILLTFIVTLMMVGNFRSGLLVSLLLPFGVLLAFVAMKFTGVDANLVALAGIAIAIGTMVDVGIVLTENVLRHLDGAPDDPAARRVAVHTGAAEVGGAVLTAVATTVVGFLPVFAMEGAEGKLFRPLAWTKTFALVASILLALVVVPPAAAALLAKRGHIARATAGLLRRIGGARMPVRVSRVLALAVVAMLGVVLAEDWAPIGVDAPTANLVFTFGVLVLVLGGFWLFRVSYASILRFCLRFKLAFLTLPLVIVVLGAMAWLGADTVFGFLPDSVRQSRPFAAMRRSFPGLGQEFLPAFDEGSFLVMPVLMSHASIGESLKVLQAQDRAIRAIPEVENVVGKIGRVDSALDPAPVSMIETVVTYAPEWKLDATGRPRRFRFDEEHAEFVRDAQGELIPDDSGRPFRNWRAEIRTTDDLWNRIAAAARYPGVTTATKLGPIETRRVMLQTGMRASMGVKVQGPDLETVERVGLEIERLLRQVPEVDPRTVFADRVVGKPYIEIEVDREAIARYGLSVRDVQDVIEVAIGGRPITTSVEGRERYPIRVRYLRELRDRPEELDDILVPAPMSDVQIPLGQLATIRYTPGPQAIKSEDTFLTGYVTFGKRPGVADVDVVEACRDHLAARQKAGELALPAGVSYRFAGEYQNQLRAAKKLRVVMPIALLTIFLLLYLQFRKVWSTFLVFSGVFVAWAGGFLLLWLWNQPWFLDFSLFGRSMHDLFQIGPTNLSVAVWVGFLALFGIATDDGVLMGTYVRQSLADRRPATKAELRDAVVEAGKRRIRPCLMTSATTILALLPVVTSQGRGSEIMLPMALPSLGGMTIVLISVFVVPTLWCAVEEWKLARSASA